MFVQFGWCALLCVLAAMCARGDTLDSKYPQEDILRAHYPDEDIPDISPDPNIFEADRLHENEDGTINTRYMASVGNGHLATNVYSDTIYVNGIFNGEEDWSHRARIQNVHAFQLHFDGVDEEDTTRTFRLDTQRGVYEETVEVAQGVAVYRTYAHRYYNRILMTEVTVNRGEGQEGDLVLVYTSLQGDETESIEHDPPQGYGDGYWYQFGRIWEPETDYSGRTEVHIYRSELLRNFTLPDGIDDASFTHFMAIDSVNSTAEANFVRILAHVEEGEEADILRMHEDEWANVWANGRIELDGDLELAKTIRGSLYYLYSNLPSKSTFSPLNQFTGLSPGGLANGRNGSDYYGHVFWDMETWMYPPILMLDTELAKAMLSYRINCMEEAFLRAIDGGYFGTRFPWESAYTGIETTPRAICIPCRENQQHITSDIAFAARQYFSATREMDWLTTIQGSNNFTGFEFVREMAHFWYTRPSFNFTKDRYEILGVMPPDEHHQEVDNSVYTNILAALSVHYARYAACLVDREDEVPDRWLQVVERLFIPFHQEKRYHEEFENYDQMVEDGEALDIKQADVVLLGFPFMWNMPTDVRRNDLDYYENVTVDNGPAMTWSMHAIGWLELGEPERAEGLFRRAYQPYLRTPFRIWTEVAEGLGAVNFITGQGGFLQAVMFGYGGMRLRAENLDFLEPRLPEGATELRLYGVDYLGSDLDITVDADQVTVNATKVNNQMPLVLYIDETEEEHDVNLGEPIVFNRGPYSIYTTVASGCPLPKDHVDIDYGI